MINNIHYSIIQTGENKVIATFKIVPREFDLVPNRNWATLIVTVNSKQLKGMTGVGIVHITH